MFFYPLWHSRQKINYWFFLSRYSIANKNQPEVLFNCDGLMNRSIAGINAQILSILFQIEIYLCEMEILDGVVTSQAIKDELKIKVAQLTNEGKKIPHLAAVLVGNSGASETYVGSKVKTCEEIGFKSTLIRLEEDISENRLLTVIEDLNLDYDVDGILVQLPLPKHISDENVINAIDPTKDVDGFHPVNVGKLVQGLPGFVSATPYGIMFLLAH